MKKIAWIDVETGGLDPKKNALLELAMILSVDGCDVEEQVFNIAPFKADCMEEDAMRVNGFTLEQIEKFRDPDSTHQIIEHLLSKYVNRYDCIDKFVFAGYNARFDMDFVRSFFIKAGDPYFGSYFYPMPLDVMTFVACGLLDGKLNPSKSWKLGAVCQQLGIELMEAHSAMADIKATRQIYLKLK